ncbi:unnamed protein product [Closterium sp. NIES-53]
MWLDDLQLYLLSDSRDSVSLFDHTSGAAPTPPATADTATRSQWLLALYDAVVARYFSAATAALGRLLLPYLFPELSAFATVEDLVSHLRTSDARYRAAIPGEFITLYFIVTRLPDSLRAVRDHFLALDPTALTVDLLEQHLLPAETSVATVDAARGTPRMPFFEGCSPSPLAPSYTSAAAVDVLGVEDVGAASASGKRRSSKGKGGRGGGGGSGGGGGGSSDGGGGSGGGGSSGSGGGSGGFGGGGGGSGGGGGHGGSWSGGGQARATQRGGSGGGQRQQQQRRSETPSPQQLREWFSQRGASGGSGSCPSVIRTEFGDEAKHTRWAELLMSGVAIFDLDYDAILVAMYALSFSQRQGRDYELHSLDFSTACLQGSLHEEMWLRRPPGFTGSFPAGTHDGQSTGFTPLTVDPSLFVRTDTSLLPFYVLVYVNDLVFATTDTEALTLVKSERQKRNTCTNLGEMHSYLGLQITRDRARRTITLTQSHMVQQVLQRFGFHFSLPQPTPLSTSRSLSAPPSDEFVELSGPYPELVGCLMYPMTTSGMGLFLGGRGPVVLTGHADASWVDDLATQRSSQGYTFSLGSDYVSWRSIHSSSVLSSSFEAEIYAGAMAAQELLWLTYLMTDLGKQPRSPPQRGQLHLAYVATRANAADIFTKALPPGDHQCFSTVLGLAEIYAGAMAAQELLWLTYLMTDLGKQPRSPPQRGQLHLAYVATRANAADIFTKALPPGDHQRFSTVLGLVPTLPHLLTA